MRADEQTRTVSSNTGPVAGQQARGPHAPGDGGSFSGNETNKLFMNEGGAAFEDVSGVSGLDDRADGRAFAVFDYDRDGWQDVAVVNANEPALQLFRSRLGDAAATGGNFVAVRLVGGNRTAEPSETVSNRDGYGAQVTVEAGELRILREHRAGDGFAGQNSATLLIGIDDLESAELVAIRWPSGRTSEITNIAAGTLVTAYETGRTGSGEAEFTTERYVRPSAPRRAETRIPKLGEPFDPAPDYESDAVLHAYTTFATWCEACEKELPQLRIVRQAFSEDELALYALPVDIREGPAEFDRWMEEHRPPYHLIADVSDEMVELINRMIIEELRMDGIPVTFITDREGRILRTLWGEPTISVLRQILDRMAD